MHLICPELTLNSKTSFETVFKRELAVAVQGLYTEMKFERPSRIQALTLPMILTPDASGTFRDLIAQAHNGSGKTTCFVLAMLSRWVEESRGCGVGRLSGKGGGGSMSLVWIHM